MKISFDWVLVALACLAACAASTPADRSTARPERSPTRSEASTAQRQPSELSESTTAPRPAPPTAEEKCAFVGSWNKSPTDVTGSLATVTITQFVNETVLARHRLKGAVASDEDLYVAAAQTLTNLGFRIVDRDTVAYTLAIEPYVGAGLVYECSGRRHVFLHRFAFHVSVSNGGAAVGIHCRESLDGKEWTDCPVTKGTFLVGTSDEEVFASVIDLIAQTASLRAARAAAKQDSAETVLQGQGKPKKTK